VRSAALSEVCRVVSVPALGGMRESRAWSSGAKAMEGVKNLECGPEELPGVEDVECTDGGGGNWGGPPQSGGVRKPAGATTPYNRRGAGKWTLRWKGVGGGHSTDRAGWTTQPPVMGRTAASFTRALAGVNR
jgi:hypothetical protein